MKKINFLPLILLLPAFLPLLHGQLANVYPHDLGIETDPAVLYVEKFEDGMANILSRYQDKKNTAGMSLNADVPPGSTGLFSLRMTNVGGVNSGGHLYKKFAPGWDSTVYVRYYVKYPSISQGYIHHESIWFGGYNPATPWPNPQAGTCGLGDSRISIAYEPVSLATMNTYLYWGDMQHDPNGNCWGNVMIKGSLVPAAIPYDEWLCVEVMLKLNNPVSASNGELRVWHNGVEAGYWGPGFPNGSWTWDKFIVDAAGPPFPGFRWRTDPDLNINYIWIEYYDDQSPAGVSHYIQYDHLVVATKPIGPISNASSLNVLREAEPSFRVDPNPATDQMTLTLAKAAPGATLFLYNALGELIQTFELSAPVTTVDISSLRPGIYMLGVQSGSKIAYRKFIKA